jgi:ATP-dependent helicase/DNAse subunit B
MARGVLEAPDTLMHELDGHEYSASEIEAYLACPYRWFVQRALRPRELDMSFDSRERGTYAHGLLKAFYEEWHSRGLRRVQPDLLDDVLEIFSAVERSFATAASAKAFGVSETVAMAKATRWARSIVVDDADFLPFFEPVGHEVPFGSAHGVPFEFGGVRMAGRIDRVERGPEGVLAIDYKSAASVKGVRSFGTYGLVQPTVYAAAAAQLFDEDAAGGVYRSMRSLWVRGFWLEGALELGGRGTATDALASEQFEAEMARAADAVAKAVEGIRAGRIAPEPAKKTACDHCIVRGICGVS